MFKTTATKNPVVGVSVAAHAAEQEKLWKDLEAAFAETASVIRTYTGEAKSATAAGGAAHRATALQWYTKIYATVTRSPAAAEFVYSRFCRFVEADLKANVTAPIMQMYREASSTNRSQATASSDLLMFTTIGKHYEHFCVFRKYSHLVLGYLDSHYTQRNMKLSINHLMNSFFFHVVYVNVRDALATVVLAQIKKYRDGESVPMQALQNAIRMFSEIATISPGTTDANAAQSPSGMLTARDQQGADNKPEPALKKDLLDKYIVETGKYYVRAAEDQMNSPTQAQGFIAWCGSRLRLEEQLVKHLLPILFWQQVNNKLFESMLAPFIERVVTHPLAGLRYLVETSQDAALTEMYAMVKNVAKGPNVLGNELQSLIEKELASAFRDYREGLTSPAAGASPTGTTEDDAAVQPPAPGGAAAAAGPAAAAAQEALARDSELRLTLALSTIFSRFIHLVESQFASDKQIRQSIATAFTQKCNEGLEVVTLPTAGVGATSTPAGKVGADKSAQSPSLGEIFASHLDLLCRRELKDASLVDADGETRRIEVIVTLLMYLNERDIFQESHRGKLAKRLLQTTPNMDLENQVLSRLQRSLGKTFTFKMEAMLRDFALTGELQRLYAADQEARLKTAEYSGSAEKAELVVHVLTASHWPAYRCDPMQAPKSLDACLRSFRHFYATQHASRTLSWVHALGTAQLQVLFPKGVKDITCSVFQASILLTIASASSTSGRGGTNVADVARLVNLALPMVKMHTASMYLHKVFPLLTLVDSNGKPCPPNKQFHEGDLLALNPGFVHKLRKFKLAAPVAAKKEGESGRQEIETLRKAQADAAIVRIMKSRRTLLFPELEEQACQQLSKLFVPPPKLLKLRVEDLISRGYIQRDESDRNKFHYIA